ncbi:acetolactate synthase 2 catalytic subunit [Testudinibacter sp. TR-2022]|uniref:acetolactate synthase 2 catalytic subunit n=1 Tax=Testudinibacter sp. TR-2022 TaxID=2585029 RepID=UPI00111AF0A3|nr:acetolactate synthase 2 catalytic subunit [Testudinibacter sp. TR-2022]TNH01982.1 acetolactate synthase 2 catalytic subunit [Pasteurellaceae bacterium Phil31]TNH07812.1 acetolactate synthase 2 catalytic subunit [Testudinibacter sp. TR-2022]TNH09934.1 acetolactate synthase 2 catalytic subunit [Testudinibacter sp. TR-2022]TNH14445.1 acetolactate synthase 2 catalytic subunit [Testudinibacter sp. TR-2022]TNH17056.1 acetolactate synthase 2 catalytic subunit [Testudinibacter sp. TR-2022]
MNGARLVTESLKAHQVEVIFGYPGGAIMPVYDAIYDSGLDHLLCRNEQGAAMAAIGYARSSKKVGVCIATSGPGATNLITGLADALLDSVPIVAITGQVATPFIGTDAFQEIDVLGLSLACTKQSFIVQNIEELPLILAQAFQVALSGRPGPVLVDIPKDVQFAPTTAQPIVLPLEQAADQLDEHLQQAKTLLQQAKRPVLYIGGGVGMASAVVALRNFLQTTQIPSISTIKGLGAIPGDTPYYMGMVGMHGTKAANYAVQESDLLLVFGARFDDRVTGKLDTFAPHAKVIHADIDPAEINKLRQADVVLRGDLNQAFQGLCCELDIAPWRQDIQRLIQDFPFVYPPNVGQATIHPWTLLKTLSTMQPQSAVITTDVGQHQMWSAQHMQHNQPENYLTSAGLGTMGFGLPAAVGAQKARPNDCVILVSGDGSFMMNVQELGSIKRGKLPIKILLLDNQRLGMVRQWQSLFFHGRHSETILDDNPDFVTLAAAFGIQGERIEHGYQVQEALQRLLGSEGAYLLHVCIDSDENVWPLVPPGASNETMLEDIGV